MRIDLSDKRIEAEFKVAYELGLIKSPELKDSLKHYEYIKGHTPFYGATITDKTAYLLNMLTFFKLRYVEGCAHCDYREITDEEVKEYFATNSDLFTRYFGESFTLEEVESVIRKRLREEDYEKLVRQQLER